MFYCTSTYSILISYHHISYAYQYPLQKKKWWNFQSEKKDKFELAVKSFDDLRCELRLQEEIFEAEDIFQDVEELLASTLNHFENQRNFKHRLNDLCLINKLKTYLTIFNNFVFYSLVIWRAMISLIKCGVIIFL